MKSLLPLLWLMCGWPQPRQRKGEKGGLQRAEFGGFLPTTPASLRSGDKPLKEQSYHFTEAGNLATIPNLNLHKWHSCVMF